MSFFRNIRSSITRGKSSSRDTTPVRATSSISSSRPASVLSVHTEGRRDSLDSRADSAILNRGETFILNSDQESDQQRNSSNSSTLEKKSKKSKVLSKFSTFTKRKKTPTPTPESNNTTTNGSSLIGGGGATTFEHHPSDDATNTYYKCSAVDYDAQSDPFNFLYEQHSQLKLLQNGVDTNDGNVGGKQKNHGFFDSSTYRKGKASSQLKAQLEQLKSLQGSSELHEEEQQEPESEKYKTVTLNSFRKSFRDKYLQPQHEAPHNPAWFVEVEATEKLKNAHDQLDAKENRPYFLVFENENYRPGSRSPVRDRSAGRQSRSTTRSPVKRNETFRVERSETKPPSHINTATKSSSVQSDKIGPSIRVEIKNSVMPRAASGRIVPVGVAKPMPSMLHNNNHGVFTTPYITNAPLPRPKASKSTSPQRNNAYKTTTSASATSATSPLRPGKYQTLVQISNNSEGNNTIIKPTTPTTPTPTAAAFNRRNNRSNSTRIQLGGGANGGAFTTNNSNNKFNNNIGSRYSFAAPASSTASSSHGLSAYELLKESSLKPITTPRRLKQTYFGGDITTAAAAAAAHQHQPTRLMMSSPSSAVAGGATTIRTTSSSFGNTSHHNYVGGGHSNLANTTNVNVNVNFNTKLRQHHSPKRSSSTALNMNAGPISGYTPQRRDLHQPRFAPVPVAVQRRSRSPIKMPWR